MSDPYDTGQKGYLGYSGYEDYRTLSLRQKLALAAMQRERKPITNIGQGVYDAASSFSDAAERKQLLDLERDQIGRERRITGNAPSENLLPGGRSAYAPGFSAPAAAPATNAYATGFDSQSQGDLRPAVAAYQANRNDNPYDPPSPPGTQGPSQWSNVALAQTNGPPAAPGTFSLRAPQGGGDPSVERNALARAMMPSMTGEGVPYLDPTVAGAGLPASADTDQTTQDVQPPIRLASIGGAGGLPGGTGGPAAAPVLRGGLTGPPVAPAGNAPTVLAMQPAPDVPPSREPIPPQSGPMIPPIPDRPQRPAQLGPSKAMQYWSQYIDNPSVSPELRQHALRQYQLGDQYRKEKEAINLDDFHNERGKYDAAVLLREKLIREEPKRVIDELNGRLAAQKAQLDIAKNPYEVEQLKLNLMKTQGEIDHARRVMAESNTFMAQGTQFERLYDPQTGTFSPARVTPGAPAPEEKALTEGQAKAVEFISDVLPDMNRLETTLNHGMALAKSPISSFGSTVGGFVGAQNILTTQEYKDAENAIGRFKGAVMKLMSGGAVTASEAERNMPAFIPRYGDSEEEVLRKAQRRSNFVRGVQLAAGKPGSNAIEEGRKYIMDMNSELPPVRLPQGLTTGQQLDALKNLGAGQKVILSDGREAVVPWPKHLMPK